MWKMFQIEGEKDEKFVLSTKLKCYWRNFF
jgi:hypothetical protein